jgi:ArsR family transcriptional regulator, arsenate/arsenite/antimonite-responsive transcriptional repressor
MPAMDRVALALSDPIRLQVLDLLAAGRDEACCSPDNPETPNAICACDILPTLDLAPSKLSYHMKELREAGLVSENKRGRWIYYSLNCAALTEYLQAVEARFLHARPAQCCDPVIPIDEIKVL